MLDLKLPRMSGLEVLKWIRSRGVLKRLPVVVLTSWNQSSDINRAHDLGVSSYLVKPVDFEVLVDLLTQVGVYWLMVNQPPEVIPEGAK